MTRVLRAVPLALLTVLLIAACDVASLGGAQPKPGAMYAIGQPTSAVPPTSSSGPSPVSSLDPCNLLTNTEAGQLGMTQVGRHDLDGATATCRWQDDGKLTMDVSVREVFGLAAFHPIGTGPGRVTSLTVGRHAALRAVNQFGCQIAVGISDTSRIDINDVANPKDPAGACPPALRIARFVEVKLPA